MRTTSSPFNHDPLLTTEEAAIYLNRDPRTMANDRSRGEGARFASFGRMVRSRQSDLDTYIEQSMVPGGQHES